VGLKEMEGERYKKTLEIVKEIMQSAPSFKAPARFIMFKRWDQIVEEDNPDAAPLFSIPILKTARIDQGA